MEKNEPHDGGSAEFRLPEKGACGDQRPFGSWNTSLASRGGAGLGARPETGGRTLHPNHNRPVVSEKKLDASIVYCSVARARNSTRAL